MENYPKLKNRDIPPDQFLRELELEYMLALFRSKMCVPNGKRKHFKWVKSKKRQKIEDISKRTGLTSILQDETRFEELRLFVFGSKDDMPGAFVFFEKEDWKFYYWKGQNVVYEGDVAEIVEVSLAAKIVKIRTLKGDEIVLSFKSVKRVLI